MRCHQRMKMIALLLMLVLLVVLSIHWMTHYLWLSFGVVITAVLVFLVRFETKVIEAREIVLLAVLAAIAAVSRIPFASIPSVQPTTFVIMMAGFVFGAESGLIVGIVAALASNMVLGQGPWTPWQMLAWGLVGLTAGLLRKRSFMKKTWGKVLFALAWGFLFGWIMNIWGLLAFAGADGFTDLTIFIPYFLGSAVFDMMHAVSNVFFFLVFGGLWLNILQRFKTKYGLLDKCKGDSS
ncbi:energy-coupling factor transport system substrate-specific component [Evansella caseinilytica]|uniref:Energy-coupling factor transport system substrate-specific component n=1 Tax=Evansella caseinilytica TaxID=1503961 RepID=A0A1H3IR27_9BACI|nr:ECF transporter S component [Evansella caseinilytica]SDY30170.1 energy-coupling factor transport system substrate-specific component [Evansella caseinilytica]